MKETRFIAQNQEKWSYFEQQLMRQNISPDDLQRMYVELTDDLSFARTFYPNRSVRVYLNTLSQKVFSKLYETKKSPWHRFLDYWRYDLPLTVWESRKEFILALSVFLIAVAIGVVSTMIDPEFPRTILSDDYVDMTLKNIKKGDPMAVYKQGNQLSGALGITANNVFVALQTFLFGVFAGIGALFILLQNGIMVGCFQYFFVSRGFGWDSFLAIWLHGTFEISAIVIAGAAGMTLGKGLLFPGTFSQLQAFQKGAYRGFEIMTGIVPIFIVAGFVEGFFTRYTDAPTVVRLGFIIFSAVTILFYFGYYPYYLAKKKNFQPITSTDEVNIVPDNDEAINMQTLRSAGEVLVEGFIVFRKKMGVILQMTFLFTILHLTLFFYSSKVSPEATITYFNGIDSLQSFNMFAYLIAKLFEPLGYTLVLYGNENITLLWLINTLFFALFINLLVLQIQRLQASETQVTFKQFLINFVCLLPVTFALQSLLSVEKGWIVSMVMIFFLSFFLIWIWSSVTTNNILRAFGNSISLTFTQFSFNFICNLGYLAIALVFFSTASSFFWNLIADFVMMQFYTTYEGQKNIEAILKSFSLLFTTYFVLAYFVTSGGLLFYSIKELQNAETLLSDIENITTKKQIKGLEME
jgi:uncharacterized membrane protein SpoIIM required for sporulation